MICLITFFKTHSCLFPKNHPPIKSNGSLIVGSETETTL